MPGLTSQTRRAEVSIPPNIAEGFAQKSRAENAQFLRVAFGSDAELETHSVLSENLKLASSDDLQKARELLDETMRMLNKYISTLVLRTSG